MNWYHKIKLAQSGEYWIDDSGNVLGADGDTGDYNHEGHVIENILSEYDIEYYEDFENMSLDELVERGMTQDEINALTGKMDPRDYAMRNWGWIRVQGNNVQVWNLSSNTISTIANGLFEIYDESVKNETFNLELLSTKKLFNNVPWEFFDSGKISKLRDYQFVGW